MARTRLNGNHLYITKYTNDEMDPLLNRILMQHKGTGYLIIDKLNLIIAGSKDGYFVPNNDDTLLAIIDRCHGAATYEDVKKTLTFAKEIGYYDKKLCDEARIITSRDLQVMHFEASVNREEVYISTEYSLLQKEDIKALNLAKSGKKIIKSLEKTRKSKVSCLNNNDTYVSEEITSLSNGISSLSYLHKEKNSIENNIKENKIIENKINCECNSDSKSNSDNSNGITEKSMHKALKTFLQYNLIPNDPLTLDVINQNLYDLNKAYGANKVINASFFVMQTMKSREDDWEPIRDYRAYITNAIVDICERDNNSKETATREEAANDNQVIDEKYEDLKAQVQVKNEAEELERLKQERKSRKERRNNNG